MSTEWKLDAACRGMGPAMFFPDKGDREAERAALAICERCEVKRECLADALQHTYANDYGVWGGLTRAQRNRLRRGAA
jgi:hypothetical protein